jgi:hypothetical protein
MNARSIPSAKHGREHARRAALRPQIHRRSQALERYLDGKLPLKGARDLEPGAAKSRLLE